MLIKSNTHCQILILFIYYYCMLIPFSFPSFTAVIFIISTIIFAHKDQLPRLFVYNSKEIEAKESNPQTAVK